MKQIIQDLKSGATILEEVPVPQVKSGYVLIKTTRSLVSLGTERMLVEFGKANLIDKARQQPDKVKQVLDKIKTDGLQPTLEAVFNKLGQPLPLGYCNVGMVVAVGRGVTEFQVGDRVASNGNHAEYGKSTETFDINNFHTYYLQWDTEYIRAGVDGKQHYEILIKDGTGQTDAFQESFFFVLNVAVGGKLARI